MYGLINQAVKDLVCSTGGEHLWRRVCTTARIDVEDFDALEPYPDDVTFALVAAASEHLGVPQAEILRRFGRHWILFTAAHGYRDILAMFGRDFRACLRNLNRMHAHMGAMMPELRPPRFVTEEQSPDRLDVHYYSPRQGLADLVVGLLEGLAEKYGERIQIEAKSQRPESDHDTFSIVFLPI
jgi:hypothetical protein